MKKWRNSLMENRFAVLNIGNTRNSFAFFLNDEILFVTYILNDAVKYIVENGYSKVYTISVNDNNIKELEKELDGKADIIKLKKKSDIFTSKYNIQQIGIDRYINIYYAIKNNIFPSVIMDLGTADTFDYIDSKGIHLGGLITPGLETLFKSVNVSTDNLPELNPQFRDIVFGTDTETALGQGIYGQWLLTAINYASLLNDEYKNSLRIIGTGGNAIRIKDYISNIEIDNQFTIKGIRSYAEELYNE
ncbi:type III pantothenate kinase [candidate division WOR-3 bacterium]|nr:type III pantothenate kinase [candidate division WOR-3 bacterium]